MKIKIHGGNCRFALKINSAHENSICCVEPREDGVTIEQPQCLTEVPETGKGPKASRKT